MELALSRVMFISTEGEEALCYTDTDETADTKYLIVPNSDPKLVAKIRTRWESNPDPGVDIALYKENPSEGFYENCEKHPPIAAFKLTLEEWLEKEEQFFLENPHFRMILPQDVFLEDINDYDYLFDGSVLLFNKESMVNAWFQTGCRAEVYRWYSYIREEKLEDPRAYEK